MIFNVYFNEISQINIIDIGSSGGFNSIELKPLKDKIFYFGFEPNSSEFAKSVSEFKAFSHFMLLPYAVGGFNGESSLYITQSPYCSSLLEPDLEWIRRLEYSDLFEVVGKESIQVVTLNDVPELKGSDIDFLKCDTQGLELPILQHGKSILKNLVGLETETGFLKNYKDETTFSEIDEFLRSEGFLLFDMKPYRVSRKNEFSRIKTGREQLIWTEALWFKDFQKLQQNSETAITSREKALKVLILLATFRCYDFGLETAKVFYESGLIDQDEFLKLQVPASWKFFEATERHSAQGRFLQNLLRLLPTSLRLAIHKHSGHAISKKHLLRF